MLISNESLYPSEFRGQKKDGRLIFYHYWCWRAGGAAPVKTSTGNNFLRKYQRIPRNYYRTGAKILATVLPFSTGTGNFLVSEKIEYKHFLLKLGAPGISLQKSRDILPKSSVSLGFEGHTELFGPDPVQAEDPHPTRRCPAQNVWVWIPLSSLILSSRKTAY